MPPTPAEYLERVYAGVLGKIIGVYLGRPFEGWPYRRILAELGEIEGYVHDRLGVPLLVTDDDITGTFTFLRSFEDSGCSPHLTAEQIGANWLNYIIENRTILWWGGRGMSTEHTAYLRLKEGIPAPRSGSIEMNGPIVAEQIGAQIFIDGWGLINPGDPERAAHFAKLAGSVSHDGVAVECAQVVAAMVSTAFDGPTIGDLFETARSILSADSPVRRLLDDVQDWHTRGWNWQEGFERIEERYGYDRYPGNCHVIPNHAVILHALLHGNGDFSRSLMVANTCGWDTDCNSGNVGCIVGVLARLAGIETRWRDPIADRLFLPTAEGGRAITDALSEATRIVNMGRALRSETPIVLKGGAKFHFSCPGSVQGFKGPIRWDDGGLAISLSEGRGRATTPTFVRPDERVKQHYGLIASPTLYPGQKVRAQVAGPSGMRARILLLSYGAEDRVLEHGSDWSNLAGSTRLEWTVPDLGGYPTMEIGVEAEGQGELLLESLTWDGEPTLLLTKTDSGTAWRDAWVDGMDHFPENWGPCLRHIQNNGTGILAQGAREWRNYRAEATLTSYCAEEFGIAIRVQGMRRYYAAVLTRAGKALLVCENDRRTILAETGCQFSFGVPVTFRIEAKGESISAWIGDAHLKATDAQLSGGAAGFVLTEGISDAESLRIQGL